MRLLARNTETERWFSVLLRSLHLAGVVWLGAAVLGAPTGHRGAALLVLGSGALMLVMDLRAGRIALREVAGVAVLVKLVLVAWMVLDARHAVLIFWALVLGSAVTSHAPKGFRHWPTPPRGASAPEARGRPRSM
ncbi:MAG TPA: hypothetical protein VLM87_14325 [Rubrivivax sp.]|nr:hypothetical protein [Rubrivivax sp.]